MATNVLIIILIGAFILALLRFAYLLFPKGTMEAGKPVNVYIDGRFNRTATICNNLPGCIVILDKLRLPVHYRGRFYSIGYTEDRCTLMYIGRKRLYFLAHVAELIRKIVGTPEYQDPTIEVAPEHSDEVSEDFENEL